MKSFCSCFHQTTQCENVFGFKTKTHPFVEQPPLIEFGFQYFRKKILFQIISWQHVSHLSSSRLEKAVSVASARASASSRTLEADLVDEPVCKNFLATSPKKRITVVGLEPVIGSKPNHLIPFGLCYYFLFSKAVNWFM